MSALRLKPDFLQDPGLAAVLAALPAARLVGGCVRDAVIGVKAVDFDLATPDRPEAVMQALDQAGLRAVPTGLAHGTVTAISFGRGFEVTTLRRDLETDGRHAVVAFSDDWREDAARRDFTFNALSMERDGTVHDYFGGVADLRAGRVRFVGDAALRIAEDRLRVLRYFRFFARYAALAPDSRTEIALRTAACELGLLSAERVWSEVKRILASPEPMRALAMMQAFGVLQAVLPQATRLDRLAELVAAGMPADPVLRLAALADGDTAGLAEALRFSTDENRPAGGAARWRRSAAGRRRRHRPPAAGRRAGRHRHRPGLAARSRPGGTAAASGITPPPGVSHQGAGCAGFGVPGRSRLGRGAPAGPPMVARWRLRRGPQRLPRGTAQYPIALMRAAPPGPRPWPSFAFP